MKYLLAAVVVAFLFGVTVLFWHVRGFAGGIRIGVVIGFPVGLAFAATIHRAEARALRR
jgi:deoxyribose-phosphate aldolase